MSYSWWGYKTRAGETRTFFPFGASKRRPMYFFFFLILPKFSAVGHSSMVMEFVKKLNSRVHSGL